MTSFCSTDDSWISVCNTAVDWGATGDYWAGVGALVAGGTVLFAAIKAVDTFRQWQLQKITERKMAEAERILTTAYKAKRALDNIRQPLVLRFEIDKLSERRGGAHLDQVMTPEFKQIMARLQRYEQFLDIPEHIIEHYAFAKAFFGDELVSALKRLHSRFIGVVSSLMQLMADDGQNKEKTLALLYKVSSKGGELNTVNAAIEDDVASIEAICLPLLRPAGSKAA